jgi:LytS/YehU family sensor histidine kinase
MKMRPALSGAFCNLKSLRAKRSCARCARRSIRTFCSSSLNSISGLVAVDPSGARSMAQRLGDFLRDSLTLGGVGRISLEREVALVRQYLEIEQVRFGARLQVTAAVSDAARDTPVPALLLQPLVENAVRHGIATCVEGGTVSIVAERPVQLW